MCVFLIFQSEVTGAEDFAATVERFAELSGQKLPRVIRQEAREVFRIISRYTPPKNYEQGANAVARDLGRVFSPVEAGFWGFIYDQTGGAKQARLVLRRKDGTPWMIDWDHIGTFGDMARFHQGKRISRGRVQYATSLGSRTRDIGRWKEDSRMVVTHSDFAKYLNVVKRRVGIGKAGWTPALKALGIPVEGYVTRHGQKYGTVKDRLGNRSSPTFEATNEVGYIARQPQIVDNALRTRGRWLQGQIEGMLAETARETALV